MAGECFRKMEVTLTCWQDSLALATELSGFGQDWIFRGQADDWPLESSIRRARCAARPRRPDYLDPERRVITHFREQAHLVDPLLAEDVGNFEWAARIQHYGGPTRLLDFTSSFWVAVFFALELNSGANPPRNPVVWAIRGRKLYEAARDRLSEQHRWREVEEEMLRDRQVFKNDYHSDRMRVARWICGRSIWGDASQPRPTRWQRPLALHVESGRTDERIVAQGGCFMCPLAADKTFKDCLFSTFPQLSCCDEPKDYGCLRGSLKGCAIVKIYLPAESEQRNCGLEMLQRMNITAAALFPGMHGLASSQYNNLIR